MDRTVTVAWYERVGSTMDLAHTLAEGGAPHGATVAAAEQVAGRGRRGRTWVSPAGGLWLTVVCRPPGPARAECLSLRAGLAVARVLEAHVPGLPRIALKWPNDLYLDDRKLGGVLCEARWDGSRLLWVAVGVGVNVKNVPPGDTSPPGVALAAYAPGADPRPLVEPVATAVAQAALGDTAVLGGAERAEFTRRDWLRGRALAAPVSGRADGIEADGALRIADTHGGIVRVSAGEVVLR
jgi:BirA family biotin operon repressor/biotin-[acetyl-CoA-carboxylase] ligase